MGAMVLHSHEKDGVTTFSEHGFCPACGTNLDGGSILDTFREKYGDEAKAQEVAAMYGGTQWGRAVGESNGDSVYRWQCPDCGHTWDRDGWKDGRRV